MRLFGLIGYPLAQSFSKKYFDEKFVQEQLTDCRFENFPIPSIDDFPALLQQQHQLQGLAVTIPYKQQVIPFVHDISGIPEGLDACNCIRFRDGLLYGFNTDHIGFEKSFTPLLQAHHTRALVLGNGGAAAAVLYTLRKLGIAAELVSRQLHAGSTMTYESIDRAIMESHTVIINTTPLGMYPHIDACAPIPYEWITPHHFLYDVVYNPGQTLFLLKGAERGAVIKNGADMLVLQAEENWRIWNAD